MNYTQHINTYMVWEKSRVLYVEIGRSQSTSFRRVHNIAVHAQLSQVYHFLHIFGSFTVIISGGV